MPDKSDQEIWESYNERYGNYGSLSLGLSPHWRRRPASARAIEGAYVGHVDGKADVFLAKEPRTKLDFAWGHVNNGDDIDRKREMGFQFVTRAMFVKNPRLWTWTAEGHIRRGSGEEMMWRSEERYGQSQQELKEAREHRDIRGEAEQKLLSAADASQTVVRDAETNTPLRRTTRVAQA